MTRNFDCLLEPSIHTKLIMSSSFEMNVKSTKMHKPTGRSKSVITTYTVLHLGAKCPLQTGKMILSHVIFSENVWTTLYIANMAFSLVKHWRRVSLVVPPKSDWSLLVRLCDIRHPLRDDLKYCNRLISILYVCNLAVKDMGQMAIFKCRCQRLIVNIAH